MSYVFDQMNGLQSQPPAFLINIHRVSTKADAEAYVSRLRAMGAAIDEAIRLSERAAAKGVQPPKWVYPYVISDARNVIMGAPFALAPMRRSMPTSRRRWDRSRFRSRRKMRS